MPHAGRSMPYADVVYLTSIRRLAALVALSGACAAVATSCTSAPAARPAPVAAPGTSRGALPASLAVSPVVSTREWRWTSVQGLEVETAHWTIRSSLRSATFTGSLPAFYEAALRNYRNGLVTLPEPPRQLEACVFGTREEWSRYTEHRLGSDAGPYLKMGRGGFTSGGEAVLYDIGPRDTLAIAAHEGWHAYTQRVFRHPLPVWLEEGLACYMEGVRGNSNGAPPTFMPWRNFERFGELRDVVARERFVSLAELVEGTPQDYLRDGRNTLLGYYAQTWALVHFLMEG